MFFDVILILYAIQTVVNKQNVNLDFRVSENQRREVIIFFGDNPMSAAESENTYVDPIEAIAREHVKSDIPEFRSGDTVKVYTRIIEGSKERIQVFEGVVLKRHKGNKPNASFTVRKVSYNIGVERTFLLHSPRISKIEVVARGHVRRARMFYLRPLRGKAARIKSRLHSDRLHSNKETAANGADTGAVEDSAMENAAPAEVETSTAESSAEETEQLKAEASSTEEPSS